MKASMEKDSGRLTLHSGIRKPSSRLRRSLTIKGTKRRYRTRFVRRKRRSIRGRYRSRQEIHRRRSIPHESPAIHQGYDQAYYEDFKVGFAQGYEDGHFAEAASTMPGKVIE
ncbi:hypothetical protein [Paenibacillus faecalis]|uniref:hypothetical protein n=1 Tax=Paenibacillus faecalis TaxID=2079532 RepID=UPI000D0EEAB1|nr:hypothetical protein [Paenibacillus faecalis]